LLNQRYSVSIPLQIELVIESSGHRKFVLAIQWIEEIVEY
jgi:hypothetical protein